MDYDDNDAQDQNLHLSGEGSSKVSPVLHSYPLPRFDFDDNLQEHLRFDSLVENEVFLGITSQEDNQWIEEYSRGTTAIPFNSSVAESRNQNVWSEATSSESVEMLLKSVGQEEKVPEATMVEELDPNLKQSDGNQETEDSHEGLDSIVVGDTYGSSSTSVSKVECEIVGSIQNVDASVEECQNDNPVEVSETLNENASDKTSDDAIKEGSDLANESFVTELQGDSNVSKVECGNAGSSQTVNDSVEVHEMQSENASDVSKNLHSDNLSNDPNEEGSNLSNEPLTNELQEDLSVFKVEREIADSSQNVDANVEENPQEVLETPNENTSDLSQNLNSSEPAHIDEIHDDTNKEDVNLANELQKDPFVSFEGCQENEHASDLSKKLDSVEPENVDKPCDDANQKGSDLGSESLANELHEDLSENAQNVDESIEECQDNHPQEVIETVNENASDLNIHNSELLVDKMQEDLSVSKVEDVVTTSIAAEMPAEDILSKDEGAEENIETQSLEPDAVVSMDQDYTLSERGDARDPLDLKDTDIDVVEAHDSQKNAEPSSENNAPNIETEDSNVKISDETQSSEPDAVCMDQDTVSMDMDVDKAPDSQKNDEPSLPIVMAQGSEPNMALVPDTVADVESSKISSLDTHEAGNVTEDQPRSPILGVSLLHEEKIEVTVARADTDTEDIPRSPVLGVSLLPNDDNEGKGEAEGSFQKVTPEVDSSLDGQLLVVKKDADSHSDVGPNEQTVDDNTKPLDTSSDSSTKEANKELMTGEDRVEPLNLTVNMPDEQQQASVAGPSEHEKDGGSASLNKHQIFSFSDMKSIKPSESAKDKHEVTKGIMENTPLNQGDRPQSVSSNSSTKQERNFTFELATGHPGIQNLDFSKVASVSTSGALLDSTKSNKDSQITPPPSESGAKKTTERKPRKKSVGKETAKKTPTRRSGTQKSPTSITTPATVLPNQPQPDLNHPSPILHQSFTDSQQVQLRAQILVYGSLISGTSPEEPHMIAAFGQSESGRKAWEAAWHACIERVHGHKSQINNNPQTPLHLRSGHQELKTDSPQSKLVVSTPIITGTIVSPMNPISTPLWNISTPHDRLHSTAPRSPLFDYRQSLSPLHSFQTQQRVPPQTFSGNTPSWPSGQWVASLPVSPFGPRFSSLPITEAVKLTTVKESGAPVLPPVDPTSNESKSRKRKKPTATNAISIPSVPSPTPVAFLTPVSTPKTNQFLSALSSPGPTHGQTKPVDRNVDKSGVVAKDETLSKIEESKLQATEAAEHAAVAVKHCQDVWTQLEKQKSCGLVPDDESKLASSAVSIAAAASVAKVAAAAAKLASNVAEQARLMADEVFLSSTHSKSTTPDHSSSVLSVAREAARRRIEAASAASKHAENLDAVVKAAELAAEAVAQAGKIVGMGKPLSLSELVDKGPEGYWKTPQKVSQSGSSGKKIQSLKHGLSLSLQDEHPGDLVTSYEKDKSKVRVPDLGIGPILPVHARDVDQVMMTESRKDNNITEGCLVEVYRDDNKNRGAWFAANVLALNDGKAFVCYTEIQSDEGSGKLKEWVPLPEGSEAPRIRMAHPMTTLRFEGAKKRGRTVLTDYSWCSGDHVDVWVQDSWQEAVVVETNKIDLTSLTVQFPAQGKTSVVRSWHVRPTLVYKDGKWIEWSSIKGHHSSEGDTPQEKRQKYDKEKEKPWNSVDIETAGHQESRIPTFITQKSSFDIGKSTSMDDNKQKTHGPIRGGLQKERSRVVFGVPKPGKKQKFMDVSRHYVGDGSNKNNNNNNSNLPNNSVKKIFVNDSKEKQVAEVSKSKPPPKFRKPPVPTLARTLSQKDKPKSSVSEKTVKDSVSGDGNLPGQQNETGVNDTPKQISSLKVVSEHRLNKRKIPSGNLKASKVEVKENLTSESEPRRSNRKIQPTSRLLEGLQSSLTISKMPTVSKVMSKGSPRPG